MKPQQPQSPLPVIIDNPNPIPPPAPVEVRSVPAVAVPIPVKNKKPRSLPASGENSYVDQNKDVDLLHRLERLAREEKEEIDNPDVESKFGIAWTAVDDAIEDAVNKGPKRLSPFLICY